MPARMFRHVPNALTAARLFLAGVFFVLLGFYQYAGRGDPWLLNIAFAIYVVALVTDFLDGYLARRWKVEGAFGRVVDPFVDKVLVIGSFIFFAGKNFIVPHLSARDPDHYVVDTITGVAPWMVVVILARAARHQLSRIVRRQRPEFWGGFQRETENGVSVRHDPGHPDLCQLPGEFERIL